MRFSRFWDEFYCLLSTVYFLSTVYCLLLSKPLRDAANQAHGVAGDEQLLVGGDDVDGEARAVAADDALAPRGRRVVRRRVQLDAHPAQALAGARAHLRRVLAD